MDGHTSQFFVVKEFWGEINTTIPRTGFNARLAIPVLKDREVMSSIAVPVVSEPVPAVVGIAIRGDKVLVIGKPFPTGALIKSMRSESLYTENLGKRSSNVDKQRGLTLTGSQLWQCQ
jgi:hypothetical protein